MSSPARWAWVSVGRHVVAGAGVRMSRKAAIYDCPGHRLGGGEIYFFNMKHR